MELVTAHESRYRHILFEAKGSARRVGVLENRLQRRNRREQPTVVRAEQVEFLRWMLGRGGVDFDNYRLATLAKRIPACLRVLSVGNVFEAKLKLEEKPGLVRDAVNAVLIGVTEFFRDREVFENISRLVMPRLANQPHIRCWSAGCSDGAEAYSLAILLAEAGLLQRARIHASDCRSGAIELARRGLVSKQLVAAIPAEMRTKYFYETREGLQVCKMIREKIDWKVGDIFSHTDRCCWDLIMCRNLVIYCDLKAVGNLWTSLHEALGSGGFLIVGRAESPRIEKRFARMAPCIYQKNGGSQ